MNCTDLTSSLFTDCLQEGISELLGFAKDVVVCSPRGKKIIPGPYQYTIDFITGPLVQSHTVGHLLTGFSAKLAKNPNLNKTIACPTGATPRSVDKTVHSPSLWEATFYIGPRTVSIVRIELSMRRTLIPFFKSDSPLIVPLFLLHRWPIKIQFNQICGSDRSDIPRVYMNTKWLTRSIRRRIKNQCEIQITYWPAHSIAIHQLRLIKI